MSGPSSRGVALSPRGASCDRARPGGRSQGLRLTGLCVVTSALAVVVFCLAVPLNCVPAAQPCELCPTP